MPSRGLRLQAEPAAADGSTVSASHAPATRTQRSGASVVFLAAIVLGGVALKVQAWPEPVGHHALDGSNYFQVAESVASGEGLQTRLSLYHQGFQSFPHPTNIYPLWPLLLGHVASWTGDLRATAVGLPIALYALALVLLYALTNALSEAFPRRPEWRSVPSLNAGHVVTALFALNPVFFRHTSLPYAEGLVYVATFAALLAVDRSRTSHTTVWAGVAGALAAAAFLSRPQMLPLPVAVAAAIALTARDRRDYGAAAASLLVSVGLSACWALHLASFVSPFTPSVLLDFAAYRETEELAPFVVTAPATGVLSFLADRAAGIGVAFHPLHPHGYVPSFGPAVYLVPLALLALAQRAPAAGSAWAWLRRPASRTVVATALAGLGSVAIVHLHRGTLIWEWWFHWRHGLPMILPIALSLLLVSALGSQWLRGAAVLLVAGSLLVNTIAVQRTASFLRFATFGPSPAESALLAWADAQAEAPRLVSTRAQALAAFSKRAGFHWLSCGDDPRQTATLLGPAQAEYVVLYPGEDACPSIRPLLGRLPVVASFGDLSVVAWRPPA